MPRRERAIAETEKLRRLLYLVQGLKGEDLDFLRRTQASAARLPANVLPAFTKEVRQVIGKIKREVKSKLSDEETASAFNGLTSAGDGYVYIPKWYVDQHWFGSYERVFPRWPHVPEHALVMFDSNPEQASPYSLFVIEAALLHDVMMLWKEVEAISSDGLTFRTRAREQQFRLVSFLRATTTVVFHFLEAYLNGLAFDCFQRFHKGMDLKDHDLLAEWNSQTKQQRFVGFERKLKEYPRAVGKYHNRSVEVGEATPTKHLSGEGKQLRDALTHPSPFVNFEKTDPGKLARVISVNPTDVGRLIMAAIEYVEAVELALDRNLALSVPWLVEARRHLVPPTPSGTITAPASGA